MSSVLRRGAGERDAGLQRVGAARQQAHAGFAWVRGFERGEGGLERRRGGGCERVGDGAIEARWRAGASRRR